MRRDLHALERHGVEKRKAKSREKRSAQQAARISLSPNRRMRQNVHAYTPRTHRMP